MDRWSRLRSAVACAVVGVLGVTGVAGASATSAGAAARLPSEQQWQRDVGQVMHGSHRYLRHAVAAGDRRYAINLDIDNTSLASYYRRATPVPAVLAFARYAHRHGVAVLFNTGRVGAKVTAARRMLRNAGYPVSQMCGRSRLTEPLAHGKRLCRARYLGEGYTIVANVGNNATDFSGPRNYGRAFRLPNYGGRLG